MWWSVVLFIRFTEQVRRRLCRWHHAERHVGDCVLSKGGFKAGDEESEGWEKNEIAWQKSEEETIDGENRHELNVVSRPLRSISQAHAVRVQMNISEKSLEQWSSGKMQALIVLLQQLQLCRSRGLILTQMTKVLDVILVLRKQFIYGLALLLLMSNFRQADVLQRMAGSVASNYSRDKRLTKFFMVWRFELPLNYKFRLRFASLLQNWFKNTNSCPTLFLRLSQWHQ